MNPYVERILSNHLGTVITGDNVAVPDDEEEMNWRLFFAHSQDMVGFRADVFTGGQNEAHFGSFKGLRDRWPDSRIMISSLAQLWEDDATREKWKQISNLFRPKVEKTHGIRPALDLLRGDRGDERTRLFALTLDDLKGTGAARKTIRMIRAYVQNSHLLKSNGCSFRTYLASVALLQDFTPSRIPEAERLWIAAIVRDFYNVGTALANYMTCDWLLWLWREGHLEWFESYKEDSVHQRVVRDKLPVQAAADRAFVAYCKTIPIPNGCGALSGKPCPPRVLNECIWLEENASSG